MNEIDVLDSKYYINRELSWLEFNKRVLEEAHNDQNPLIERIRFLSIFNSNLDEFFMVRVAFLKRLVHSKIENTDPSGLTPKKQLSAISKKVHHMVNEQYALWNFDLLPELTKSNISFISINDLRQDQLIYLDQYFNKNIYPVLTPLGVDSSRPFPLILNCSLNIAALIKSNEMHLTKELFAIVQIPSILPRLIEIPKEKGEKKRKFIFLEDIIKFFLKRLFNQKEIDCSALFRITRDSDLVYQEEEASNLLKVIEQSLKKRKWGQAIRLEVSKEIDDRLLKILKNSLKIHKGEIYFIDGPIDLNFLPQLTKKLNKNKITYPPHIPKMPKCFLDNQDMLATIEKKDILLFHPYDSFEPVIKLIENAANDPDVLAIKQTLYRVSSNSPIIAALARAAEKGKQVTVVVELRARFDESHNINWARNLENAGCHVIYGMVGLKVHAKITLIIRKEKNILKRYLHLATGNYNDITSCIYSDLGLLTCDESIGSDVSALFNMLSGYSTPPNLFKIEYSPITMRNYLVQLIDNEIENARQSKAAHIIAKMNSLEDKEIISKLYKASKSGVKIDLIVRGICCLRPGVPGLSDHISVRSIVGRFLEHARIYYFNAGGLKKYFLSSADCMTRNFDRRVEIFFPIESEYICNQIRDILEINLKDNVKARIMESDGTYQSMKNPKNEPIINTHSWLMENWREEKGESINQ